ncbi:CBO0543 family protein [Sutcliffiella sp. NPDC057660]|uniref:CBO0543 family protein n=1 Tax=Sutcliffiella sp. NPDC057660 TaxID=3346199 RepID=UPI00368BCEA9
MHVVYNLIFLLIAWKWGDWKNWEKYYPTILFYIIGDLLHNFIMYNHHVWVFHENLLPELLPNHTFISLVIMFVCYPATILIYLKYFFRTKSMIGRALQYGFWVAIYLVIEYVNLHFGLISHHNSWHMGWSLLFLMVMFALFPIHFKKPLVALILSIPFVLFLWFQFDIPIEKLK